MGENTSDDARQLRRTIHHLSASYEILTAENKGLSATVAAQNPQRRSGRLLTYANRRRDAAKPSSTPLAKYATHVIATGSIRRRDSKKRWQNTIDARSEMLKRYATSWRKRDALLRTLRALGSSRQRRAEEAADRGRRKQERDAAESIQYPNQASARHHRKHLQKPIQKRAVLRVRGVVLL